jgi:hypothetical protein
MEKLLLGVMDRSKCKDVCIHVCLYYASIFTSAMYIPPYFQFQVYGDAMVTVLFVHSFSNKYKIQTLI